MRLMNPVLGRDGGGFPAFCLLFPIGIVISPLIAQVALKSAAGAFTRNVTEESNLFVRA